MRGMVWCRVLPGGAVTSGHGGERGGGRGMNGKPRFTLASNDIQGRFLGKK